MMADKYMPKLFHATRETNPLARTSIFYRGKFLTLAYLATPSGQARAVLEAGRRAIRAQRHSLSRHEYDLHDGALPGFCGAIDTRGDHDGRP